MMSDGSLSQDEIDALLFQGGGSDTPEAAPAPVIADSDKEYMVSLLEKTKDGIGQTLSGMLGKTTTVTIGSSKVTDKDTFLPTIADEMVEVKLDYTGEAPGEHLYLIGKDDALKIAGLMSGQDGLELDAMALASIGEAISQITGTMLTSIEKEAGKNISPSAPEAQAIPKAMFRFPEGNFVVVDINLSIEGDGEVKFQEIFDAPIVLALSSANQQPPGQNMGQQMGGQMQQPSMGQPMGGQMQQPNMGQPMGGQMQQPNMGQPMGGQMGYGNQQMGGQMQQPMMGQPMGGQMGYGNQPMYQQQNVQGVQYPPLNQVDLSDVDSRNIGLLMDVSMELTVELGRTKWQIKEILGIGEGTIIELDKLAGEPVDILVNKNLIARGEVVVIDENFGVRVTEIISAGAKAVEG